MEQHNLIPLADEVTKAGLPFRDYKAWLEYNLRKECERSGMDIDKVLCTYSHIDSLICRSERYKPGLRKQIVEKFTDHHFVAAFNNLQTMKHLIRKINYPNIIDHAESDLLFMLFFLTLYDGLYARIINILYGAANARDQNTDKCVGTTGKAKRLAGEGIDIRDVMRVDIRNAAAHMGFVAGGGLIDIKTSQKMIVTTHESMCSMEEFKDAFGKERVDHIEDVVNAAQLGAFSLYFALLYWYEMYEGPWRLFSKEFFSTWPSFCMARDAVQQMRDLSVEKWDDVVRDARMKLTAVGDTVYY